MLKPPLTSRPLLTAAVLAASLFASPASAQAYPIDCAILLCLAGGFPPSAECTAAKAVMIRRITPWPIEPPLQIWRCPMGSADAGPEGPLRSLRAAIDARRTATIQQLVHTIAAQVSDENGIADIDISGPEFAFVRSIEVWDVRQFSHFDNEERGCRLREFVIHGTYGPQGDFRWQHSSYLATPGFVIPNKACSTQYNFRRGVGIQWTDQTGATGHEWVSY